MVRIKYKELRTYYTFLWRAQYSIEMFSLLLRGRNAYSCLDMYAVFCVIGSNHGRCGSYDLSVLRRKLNFFFQYGKTLKTAGTRLKFPNRFFTVWHHHVTDMIFSIWDKMCNAQCTQLLMWVATHVSCIQFNSSYQSILCVLNFRVHSWPDETRDTVSYML